MKRTVIYPFSFEHMALVKYLEDFNDEIKISAVVSPAGSGLCGKDAGEADNRGAMGVIVSDDLFGELEAADALLVPWLDEKKGRRLHIFETMVKAVKMGRHLISSYPLNGREKKQLAGLCREKGISFTDTFREPAVLWRQPFVCMNEMPVPVIYIGGIFNDVNHFEIAAGLAQKFKEHQFKVSAVGIRPEYHLFGFHYSSALAEFVRGKIITGDIRSLITHLNSYMYQIIVRERLDALIVDIPGGLIDTPQYPNESGIFAYLMSQVAKPDYMIATSLYTKAVYKDFLPLLEEIDRRFTFETDCIHISNKYLDSETSEQILKMEFGFVPLKKALALTPVSDDGKPRFCLLDEAQMEMLYEDILRKLGE